MARNKNKITAEQGQGILWHMNWRETFTFKKCLLWDSFCPSTILSPMPVLWRATNMFTYSHATPQPLSTVTSYKNCSYVLWHTSQITQSLSTPPSWKSLNHGNEVWPIHSFIYKVINSFIHSFFHSLNHSPTRTMGIIQPQSHDWWIP